MKIKFLRKLRKKYHWHFDHTYKKWVFFDKKTNQKFVREHSFIAIGVMVGDYLSFGQHIDYIKRKERILDKKEYSESLKINLVEWK